MSHLGAAKVGVGQVHDIDQITPEAPDDEHEHLGVPKLPHPTGHPHAGSSNMRWSEVLLPAVAKFGFSCSDAQDPFCADSRDKCTFDGGLDGPASLIVPLPAVALEGPADLPKSSAIAVCSLDKKKRAGAPESFPGAPAPATPSKAPSEAQPTTPSAPSRKSKGAEASKQQPKAEPAGSKTLKFYPQPSDDRNGTPVDVIEHGYEVLIVRREPSPSPRCPASVLGPYADANGATADISRPEEPSLRAHSRSCSADKGVSGALWDPSEFASSLPGEASI
eukprot:TRINITY_DN25750_c0_g1_i1.p1 TRINITY_DN25750_c0_g1~~TRINITY_DN25750_c0_g1_i1.p1  ORF type:complete len:278 (+),score=56.47 TRINITY_DN25750_c0_g1_i1:125-958(+)